MMVLKSFVTVISNPHKIKDKTILANLNNYELTLGIYDEYDNTKKLGEVTILLEEDDD